MAAWPALTRDEDGGRGGFRVGAVRAGAFRAVGAGGVPDPTRAERGPNAGRMAGPMVGPMVGGACDHLTLQPANIMFRPNPYRRGLMSKEDMIEFSGTVR